MATRIYFQFFGRLIRNEAFVGAYEQMMRRSVSGDGPDQGKVTYRRLILNQVRRFADHLLDPEQAYTPFVWSI